MGDKVDKRGAMLGALLNPNKNQSLIGRFRAELGTGNYTTQTPAQIIPGQGDKYVKGGKIIVRIASMEDI